MGKAETKKQKGYYNDQKREPSELDRIAIECARERRSYGDKQKEYYMQFTKITRKF